MYGKEYAGHCLNFAHLLLRIMRAVKEHLSDKAVGFRAEHLEIFSVDR
jgi:2,4-dienoyl-CoA reductase-like NADH-dependent reductase (Old Yellow Enzyme family)